MTCTTSALPKSNLLFLFNLIVFMPINFLSIIFSLFAVAAAVAAQDTTMVVSDALSDSLPQEPYAPVYAV